MSNDQRESLTRACSVDRCVDHAIVIIEKRPYCYGHAKETPEYRMRRRTASVIPTPARVERTSSVFEALRRLSGGATA